MVGVVWTTLVPITPDGQQSQGRDITLNECQNQARDITLNECQNQD